MILMEMYEHGAFEELHVLIGELRKRGYRGGVACGLRRTAAPAVRAALLLMKVRRFGLDIMKFFGAWVLDWNLRLELSYERTCVRVRPLHGKPVVAPRAAGRSMRHFSLSTEPCTRTL
jgi:hypothetical protein